MSKGEYSCKECGEKFDNRVQAVVHHLQTKHQNYELVGADIDIFVKS